VTPRAAKGIKSRKASADAGLYKGPIAKLAQISIPRNPFSALTRNQDHFLWTPFEKGPAALEEAAGQ